MEELKSVWSQRIKHTKEDRYLHGLSSNTSGRPDWTKKNLLESVKPSSARYCYGVCSPTSPCCLFFILLWTALAWHPIGLVRHVPFCQPVTSHSVMWHFCVTDWDTSCQWHVKLVNFKKTQFNEKHGFLTALEVSNLKKNKKRLSSPVILPLKSTCFLVLPMCRCR